MFALILVTLSFAPGSWAPRPPSFLPALALQLDGHPDAQPNPASAATLSVAERSSKEPRLVMRAAGGAFAGHALAVGAGLGVSLASVVLAYGSNAGLMGMVVGAAAAAATELVAPPILALRAARIGAGHPGGNFAWPFVTHLAVIAASLVVGANVDPVVGVATFAVGTLGVVPWVAVRSVRASTRIVRPEV